MSHLLPTLNPTWSPVPTPSGLNYLFVCHNQSLYYDTNLQGWAFRPANVYTDTAGTTLATTAGDSIARWNDTSGNGIVASQSTAASRPKLQFSQNSVGIWVPKLRFDGVDDALVTTTNVTLWPSKRGGIYGSWISRSSCVAGHTAIWGGSYWNYVWYTQRFYDGAFSGADTGFDNGMINCAIVRTADTNRAYYLNGTFVNNTSGNDLAAFSGSLNLGQTFQGDLHAFLASPSGTYSSTINDYVVAMSPAYPTARKIVVCDGNSLTSGVGGTSPIRDYPNQMQTMLGDTWTVKNVGVASQQTSQMTAAAATRVDTLFSGAIRKVVVCWEGTNALYFGASAATAYSQLVSYCAARRAAGEQVIICTILPRSNASTPGTFEADRQTVNTSIRTNWMTIADGIADVANDPRIGSVGQDTDTKYFADLVHCTSFGYQIVAKIVADAVLALSS